MGDAPRFCATEAARTSRNGDRPLIPATRRSLLHTLRQNPTGRPQDSLRKATFLKWSGCRHVATSRPFQKGRLPQGILWPSGWILPQGVQQAPAGRGDQGTITVPACPGGLGSAKPRCITHSTQLKGTIKNWRPKTFRKALNSCWEAANYK